MIQNQTPQPENSQNLTVTYDWEALKTEFMRGPWKTVAEFKKDQQIPDNAYLNIKMRGWAKEKMELVADAVRESAGELVEITPTDVEVVRKRQADHARLLQKKGLDALEVFTPKNADEARKMVVSGLQEERAALGVFEKGGSLPNLTQVNVNLPKTKFDKIVNDQDFAGILKFIAEVKRERARRVGTVSSSESKATAG